MSFRNPMTWPVAGKIAGAAALMLAVGGASFGVVSATDSPAPAAHPAASTSTPSTPQSAPPASQVAAPSGLAATCQVGSSNQPASQQDYDAGGLDYLIAVTDDTGKPVTLLGYTVTFTAFSQTIDTENPALSPVLAEPGEQWTYTGSYQNAPQVSESTYLDETCTVAEVDTADGPVEPGSSSSGPNGNSNTRTADIANAQKQLSDDVGHLSSDAASLDNDTSLSQYLQTEKSGYGTEQQAYQQEQTDGCPAASGDAGAISGYASAVGGYDNSLQGGVSSLQDGGISTVKGDLTAAANDLSALKGLGASPQTPTSSAVAAGNNALTDAASAISYATSQGNQYVSEANSLAHTAADWASNHGCPM
jgi:hypothetical protein